MNDIVQVVAASLGLLTVIMYVFGGLIVFLYLARYGIIDYQLFQLKFLVTGIYFLLMFLATVVLSFIPALFLVTENTALFALLLVASLFSSVSFVLLRYQTQRHSRWHDIRSLILLLFVGAVGLVYPIAAVIRSFYTGVSVLDAFTLRGLAFITTTVLLVTQAYYYATHVYGALKSRYFRQEPFGMGIPVRVKFVGSESDFKLLSNLGVPLVSANTTEEITLIDETSDYYIIRAQIDQQYRAVKIAKDIVKGVLYIEWE